ncbi:MAG: hypothetical protein IJ447_02895 [Clostridia bacterium]|nr:hypothetical protein [Clostridia bacterium]
MADSQKNWYELDNAASIYPYSSNRQWICGYRIGFVLKEDIDPEILKQAVRDIMPRFPSYFVQLRFGYFWPYLEKTMAMPIIEEEHLHPILPTPRWYTNVPAMKIIYYKRRLCFETFHGIADGGATITVLKALTAQYLRLKGIEIPESDLIVDINEKPLEEETTDCFKKVYDPKKKGMTRKETVSYQHPVHPILNYNRLFEGLVPVEDIKKPCKEKDVTITELLTAVFIYSIYQNSPESNKKPIKISVPVSLRPIFGFNSMRNFSLFTNIGAVLKSDKSSTIDDILEAIKGKLKEGTQKEVLEQNITMNVNTASNPIVKILPNGLKRQVLKIGYKNGQQKFACTLSNLGVCKMPPEMKEHIDRMEVFLGGPRNAVGCAVNSIDDKLNIAFNVASKQTDIVRTFYKTLADMGMHIRVESSDWR